MAGWGSPSNAFGGASTGGWNNSNNNNNNKSQPAQSFKLVICGDGGCGATAWIKRHRTGEFEQRYIATIGVEVHPLTLKTTSTSSTENGSITFNCWDTAGQEKFGGLRDGYYIQGQCAVVLMDVTSRNTVLTVIKWVDDIMRVCGENIPIVIVGNKADSSCGGPMPQVSEAEYTAMSSEERVKRFGPRQVFGFNLEVFIQAHHNVVYCEMSVKDNLNTEEPLLILSRLMLKEPMLEFSSK